MRIRVTKKHIARAIRARRGRLVSGCCPVAQALMERLERKDIAVGFTMANVGVCRSLRLSDEVMLATNKNSSTWRHLKPFTFTATWEDVK